MKSDSPLRQYYPALDGLRGIAIILVLICHNLGFLPYARLGEKGVDLFFVLSGFLITEILLNTRGRKYFLGDFFLKRIFRIFPLYYLSIVLFFIAAPHFQSMAVQFSYYRENQSMLWFHLQNWMYILNQTPENKFLFNHFWSLSVEEQYYLFWPLCLLLIRNTKTLKMILGLALIGMIGMRLLDVALLTPGYTSYQLHYMTHADGLCIGGFIAILKFEGFPDIRKLIWKLLGAVLVIHLFMLVLFRIQFPTMAHIPIFGYTETALAFGLILSYCIQPGSRLRIDRLLDAAPLRYFGRISFGLYVFHWPILIFCKYYLFQKILPAPVVHSLFGQLLIAATAFVLSLVVSILSFEFFERKILLLKTRITTERILQFVRKLWPLLPKPVLTK